MSEVESEFSYVFSRYGPIWGWASWRRAWAHFDLELRDWPSFKRSGNLASIITSAREREWRTALYDRLSSVEPPTWDYQWGYAKLFNSMLSIIPSVNLIENIGFGPDATHTADEHKRVEMGQMGFPLRHPERVIPDARFDTAYSRRWAATPLTRRLLRRLQRVRALMMRKCLRALGQEG
jgi:hypothetical protein